MTTLYAHTTLDHGWGGDSTQVELTEESKIYLHSLNSLQMNTYYNCYRKHSYLLYIHLDY